MKKNPSNGVTKAIIIALALVMLLPLAASAYTVKNSDSVYVAQNETVEGNFYAVASDLTIDGRVTGDVICAGQTISISGQVDGDVICAGQAIFINGEVGGSLRVAGNTVKLDGQVARNALIAGAMVNASASSSIGWDFLAIGNIFELRGKIGRDLHGFVGKTNLSGSVGKNVNLNFGRENQNQPPLYLAPTAQIGGNLKYTAAKDAVIENGAVIGGETDHQLPKAVAKRPGYFSLAWWWGALINIFSALVIGLVLTSLWRAPIIKITDFMLGKTGPAFGWGILVLLLTVPVAIIILFTIIGIPLALILLTLWLIALYISKIFVAILVGRNLINRLLPQRKDSLILAMVIGVVVCYLLFALPLVGRPLAFVAVIWGLGGIVLALKTNQKNNI